MLTAMIRCRRLQMATQPRTTSILTIRRSEHWSGAASRRQCRAADTRVPLPHATPKKRRVYATVNNYRRYKSWSLAHERHLSTIRFEHPAQEVAFNEYRLAGKDASERVERITVALRELCNDWRMNPVVKALMCFKGLDFVGAVTFVAEMGDLTRFAHPRELMSYLGLIPSEFSSGKTRRQGEITRTGNKHARRILVEAAWDNRFKAQITRTLEVRQQGQPKIVRDISWKAQLRLSKRWRSLLLGRKLHANKICVAIARELSGFIWDAARHVKVKA
jgi:transposase